MCDLQIRVISQREILLVRVFRFTLYTATAEEVTKIALLLTKL